MKVESAPSEAESSKGSVQQSKRKCDGAASGKVEVFASAVVIEIDELGG